MNLQGIPKEFFEGGMGRRRRRSADSEEKLGEKVNGKPKLDDKVEQAFEKVTGKIFDEIDDLRENIDKLRHPRGTKESPARTCRDIKLAIPESDDGILC